MKIKFMLTIAAVFALFNRFILKPVAAIGDHILKTGTRDLPPKTASREAPDESTGERNKAEEPIRADERKFRAIFDQSFEFIGLLTPDGVLTDANRTALQFSGIQEADVLGKPFWETPWWNHSTDLQARLREAVRRVAQGEFIRFEATHPAKDGELHAVDFSLKPVKDECGKVVLLISDGRDVSERVRAEAQLKDSEDRLQILFEYAPDACYLFDLAGNFLDGNKAAEELSGYRKEELIGKSFLKLKLLSFSDVPKAAAAIAKNALGLASGPEEYSFHRKDGSLVTVEVRTYPVKIKGKMQVLGSARDITERKGAEEVLRKVHEELEIRVKERTAELARAREYAQEIVSTITDYIYTVTVRDGKPVAIVHQPTCFAVTGYTPEEFDNIPALWDTLVHEEDRPKVRKFDVAVFSGDNPGPLEHRIMRKDGELRWVRNTPVFHYDQENRLVSFDGIISDITDRKNAEISLAESVTKIERANALKSQFLANISHEIRNPLNTLVGFADMLGNTDLSSIQKDYVDMLRESGEILLSLSADFLDFSKMDAKEVRLEKICFNPEYLVQSVLRTQTAKSRKKDLKMFCSIDEAVPRELLGDPTRIRQVLTNLLGNAVKFTEAGEIEVRVTLEKEREEKPAKRRVPLKLAVRDTGIGIPNEKLGSIFRAFEQADVSTTRKYGGTGLGLSISKGLVLLMGGTIGVESEPGKGSTFFFVLPLEVAAAAEQEKIFPLKMEELKGRTVLIVDTDKKTREILSQYCQEAGMVVLYEAAFADEAFSWLARQQAMPAIILADTFASGFGGYEMAEKLRENEKYEDIKLIAVTNDRDPGAAFKASQSGFDAYLPKPIIRVDLWAVIKTALGDQRELGQSTEIVTLHTAKELACKGLRVLVVGADPDASKGLSGMLRKFGCEAEFVPEGTGAVARIKTNPVDLVIMDLRTPLTESRDEVQKVRKELPKAVPILGMTVGVTEEEKVNGLAMGISDFLIKPLGADAVKSKMLQWVSTV